MAMIYYTFRESLNATIYGLGAFGIMTANLIIFVVSFSTLGWGWLRLNDDSGEVIGLWTKCCDVADNPLSCEAMVGNQVSPGTIVAAQCFAIFSLITLVLLVGTNAVYLFVKRFNQDKRVVIALTFTCCACGASLLLSLSLWAAGFHTYTHDLLQTSNIRYSDAGFDSGLGFSFFLGVVSCLMTLIGCVLYVSELRYNKFIIPA